METKAKTEIKMFWTTNPDSLQGNTHSLHKSILFLPPTDTTIATQNTQPRFKQHTSTTTTQYTQPTHKNHVSTCTKTQPQYTTAFPCQPNTHHTLKSACTHAPLTNYHSSKRRLPLCTSRATTHLQHHIPSQPTNKTHTDITRLPTFTLAPKSSHVHQQYKHTLRHHANNNNQSTKTTHTKTTQPPQHTSHKMHHKCNQTNTLKPQHTTTSTLPGI